MLVGTTCACVVGVRINPAAICLAASLFAWPAVSSAATIVQLAGFTISGTNVSLDATAVQPFDPVLGDLESVSAAIEGTLVLSTATVLQPAPSGGFVPYSYLVDVTNDFFGEAGNLFGFSPDAHLVFSGVASGAGEVVTHVRRFTYDFTLNEITDTIGFAGVAVNGVDAPPLATGERADFLPAIHGHHVLDTLFVAAFLQGLPTPLTLGGGGSIQITYTYTPPPAPVPEPSSGFFLGLSVVAALVRRAR